jgi:hypothetical protein
LGEINQDTVVIPGHGELSDYAGLAHYIEVLSALHADIAKMVKDGKSLEAVVAAKPTAKFDEEFGDSTNFVDRAYTSIKRELAR